MHIKNGLKISVIELTHLFANKTHLAFSHCNVLGTKQGKTNTVNASQFTIALKGVCTFCGKMYF